MWTAENEPKTQKDEPDVMRSFKQMVSFHVLRGSNLAPERVVAEELRHVLRGLEVNPSEWGSLEVRISADQQASALLVEARVLTRKHEEK